MAVMNSSDIIDTTYLSSQTPPTFDDRNYYLRSLQDKIDADWDYRPNRAIVEEEAEFGSETYSKIEVVVQTVKNDKGSPISDDYYRLVFKDCMKKSKVGSRYRFGFNPCNCAETDDKNIWIGVNQTTLQPTSSQVVRRCNGSIGSIYVGENGVTSYHYEPIIQDGGINSTGFDYSEVTVQEEGKIVVIAQYNKYTKQYYINQRFVIGSNKVYKVTNIQDYETFTTFNPDDIGIIKLYMSIDQIGELDDLQNRIAYNGKDLDPNKETKDDLGYSISIADPNPIPNIIPDGGLTMRPEVKHGDTPISNPSISYSMRLDGAEEHAASVNSYINIFDNGDGTYLIVRKKVSVSMSVVITFVANINGNDLSIETKFALRPF